MGVMKKALKVLTPMMRGQIAYDADVIRAMHLHGHHFQEERPDDSLRPLRDTILMGRGQERTIVFRAKNPGDWLLHCHMLSHQVAGMKT
ncbi:multicopper oxidase domain-containing protein [Aliiroseovarius lamellibrachiae]|uniref:multicopper oxidase domain-containing protein n=1 Tax=Aliiroseovarius lamellibrachiae TaxID=1924933 RepID=UPI001BE036A7|nr:multicopper oxidase domain-containing protein [Aliiroseovarius lamellibrachiae]